MRLGVSSSYDESFRLSPNPHCCFWVAIGIFSPFILLSFLSGDTRGYILDIEMILMSVLMLPFPIRYAKKNYIVSSKSQICICINGDKQYIPWSNVKYCAMPLLGHTILYYQVESKQHINKCMPTKRIKRYITGKKNDYGFPIGRRYL